MSYKTRQVDPRCAVNRLRAANKTLCFCKYHPRMAQICCLHRYQILEKEYLSGFDFLAFLSLHIQLSWPIKHNKCVPSQPIRWRNRERSPISNADFPNMAHRYSGVMRSFTALGAPVSCSSKNRQMRGPGAGTVPVYKPPALISWCFAQVVCQCDSIRKHLLAEICNITRKPICFLRTNQQKNVSIFT